MQRIYITKPLLYNHKNPNIMTIKKTQTPKIIQEDPQELFEDELDIALMYICEIYEKYSKAFDSYTDYEGEYENGPSFNISVNTDKKGKLLSTDIHLEFKNLKKFVAGIKA
ncbi:MAG: hypothetical protein A2275_01460 [Bacteroidetes bacterium RIFOXYA12_FULL_35_11]|nr:MAG: hypothetical protein A2X01_17095 [Bacteroidetes bacterium GWF2_35_48]OFY73040.1 MAG: hypothetical protein A2275_01460 [Bacteroidetes bacterium RIFOXYA12_FULL_35_11]OFY93567.1 MAG: hypothetical protein A2309_09320 [Bacteroidetes bacterium RIFOXYB2_FULL_35_7]OFY96835.1 MAG: hypothetical protein A2491_07955 [Bacteroidetes bacterium RIFOXYC12_FULL_35_7]HBX53344.1 hypothetical protein [Bacteroidales bacterium]